MRGGLASTTIDPTFLTKIETAYRDYDFAKKVYNDRPSAAEIAAMDADDREYWGRQFCALAWGDCLNPAGYGTGNGHCGNSDGPKTTARCGRCGEPCCENCRIGIRNHWVCLSCADREADDLAEKAARAAATAVVRGAADAVADALAALDGLHVALTGVPRRPRRR